MARRRIQSGITLVEIIVCVSIVLVIGAILMPVFPDHEHGSAKREGCRSNVKHLALGLIMYETDTDDYFPGAANWADLTLPYMKDTDIYRCPGLSAPSDRRFGHAFYSALSYKKGASLPQAGTEPLVFDSSDLTWNANGPLSLMPASGRFKMGKSMVGFQDGHASLLTRIGLFNVMSGSPP